MDTNSAKYKKENPSLVNLAKVFGVPSSSSPVERLSSNTGKIFTSERCRLSDDTIKQFHLK